MLTAQRACATSCSRSSRATNGTAATAAGSTSRSSRRGASPTARSMWRPTSPAASRRRCNGAAIASKCRAPTPTGRLTSVGFDAGWYTEATRRHARHAGDRARQAGVQAGRADDGRGDGARRRQRDAQRHGRPAAQLDHARTCRPGTARSGCRSAATGAPAPMWWRPCAVRSTPQAQRMPGRAIGVQWFSIDRKASTLALDMTAAGAAAAEHDAARSDQGRRPRPGEEARVVVAAVDVGILNLTNYKPPAPDDYYLGQRQLSAELRDLYGQLIDGMQGTRGQIRTGGDAGAELQRQPADPGAAGALFRHRRGALRTASRGRVRHSGLRRHRAGHGGGLEQGQGRPRRRATSSCAIRWC